MPQRPRVVRSVEASGGAQEPPAQQGERGAPEHLAREHRQAVDVAFDRAVAPRQPEAGLDGLIVRAAPYRTAPPGCDTTGDSACQPGIETLDLTLPYNGAEIPREVDRHRHVGMLGLELRDERCIGVGAVR